MIVYRDQRSRADPHRLLRQVRSLAGHSCSSAPIHDEAVELLIQTGVLESAVVDALFSEGDGIHPLAQSLRHASIQAGHVLWHTWLGHPEQARQWGNRLAVTLGNLPAHQMPRTLEVSTPEGFAHYAVYPEMYLEAARRFYLEVGRCDVVCLGIRSIGSSLSAAVSAALEELGCSVKSFTLRPGGHPFSRRPCFSSELEAELRKQTGAFFLLIDEGPGISGSSLGGTAASLQGWGIADDHIVLFPSWRTDGSHLSSPEARLQWRQHPQVTVSFEDVWLDSGRLSATFPGTLHDLSAGAWRKEVYRNAKDYPAVQPQHERRKYLLEPSGESGRPRLLSFAGLGPRGSRKVERLARLADAGFTVAPDRLAHGFLLRPFVAGTPVTAESVNPELVERTASYLAHLSLEHAADPTVDDQSLREMISVNVGEGLQPPSEATLRNALPSRGWVERPVALDGRMLMHEWVCTPDGILKLDAMDHHDDHFFPGCQDIAWDVAAAVFELDLNALSRQHLVNRYRRLSGDRGITSRLHHYGIAYLAFRLGYATMAAGVLARTLDGLRFACLAERYARLLTSELNGPGRSWGD